MIPTKSFGDLKPKEEKAEIMTEFEFVAEKATKHFKKVSWPDVSATTATTTPPRIECSELEMAHLTKDDSYIPKTERLLAIYDMLTNISFPRKGKGKSTKPKILDAIVMAATDLILKIRGPYDD